MRYATTEQFRADWSRLSDTERVRFRTVAKDEFSPACDAWIEDPSCKFPASLRVRQMRGRKAIGVWEMTWNFTNPDGRATFVFQTDQDGPLILWRRVGTHSIYANP